MEPQVHAHATPSNTYNHLAWSPPHSPAWLQTEYHPLQLEVPKASPTLSKRQSLRLRPEDLLENNGEPPSPLNLSFQSAPASPKLDRKTSGMSLFNLFSRPNVERQRGYAEPGVDGAHDAAPPAREATRSKPNLVIRVDSEKGAPQRPASVFSGKTTATKWTKWKPKSRQGATQQPKERKPATFEAPPLFQAYPQSTRDGTLEVSEISVDTLNKARTKSNALNKNSLEKAGAGDRTSVESRRTSALKYIANGSAASVELPKKIFVLVTSGYLLQYAERGVSDRLPEKVLHLGKDSAAFACDLVPGKHYVLQVSQAVDQDGIIIANSGSFLTRLGIKTAAAKRMTSNLILVLPNADEMESWMTALREEIEALGGKKIRHYTQRPKTTDANGRDGTTLDLRKTPSQSHRYQVKRNPSKVSSVCSPKPWQLSFEPVLPDIDFDFDKKNDSTEEKRDSDAAIGDIGIDAAMLEQYLEQPDEDIPDLADFAVEMSAVVTPPAVVVEEPKFATGGEKTEIVGESVHIKSATRKVEAMSWKERKNSAGNTSLNAITSNSGSPDPSLERSEHLSTSPDHPPDAPKKTTTPRDSVRKAPPPPLALHSSVVATRRPVVDESPIIPNYPSLSQRMSTRLTNAYTERNTLDGGLTNGSQSQRHDSKMDNETSHPPVVHGDAKISEYDYEAFDEVDEDEETYAVQEPVEMRRPKRNSSLQNLQNFHSPNGSVSYRNSNTSIEPPQIRKVASFSMPLKVNPTATNGTSSAGNVRRHSRMDEIGYALTPPDNSIIVEPSSDNQSLTPASSNGLHKHSMSNASPPGRLSLFPSPRSSQTIHLDGNLKRLPSNATRQTSPHSAAATNGGTHALKRPNSLQVRSDHAPFLSSSVRNSTGTTASTTTVPIRGMKPSRSASNVAALAKQQQQSSSIEEFKALNFNTSPSTLDEVEEVDLAMPLPADNNTSRPTSTSVPMLTTATVTTKPTSRNSVRKSLKAQSSLPNLDFGLPVVGLGPPAPPPQAPLPAPPPAGAGGSRTTSPAPLYMETERGSIGAVAGLGISV